MRPDGHIFISYSHKDREIVDKVIDFLTSQGIDIWVDKQGLSPGTPSWQNGIQHAIEDANAIVVVLSPDSKDSEWVGNEISYAGLFRKQIFPILVRGDASDSVPISLVNFQRVDVRKDEQEGFNSLHTAIVDYLEKVRDEKEKDQVDAAIPDVQKFKKAKEKNQARIKNNSLLGGDNWLLSPPLTRAAYSDRMSWVLANMARLAYIPFEEDDLEKERLKSNLNSGGFNLLSSVNGTNATCFVAHSERYAVLAFRGMEVLSQRDIQDINLTSRASGSVHYGFSSAYADISMIVEKSLADIKGLPIYITGHSIGGAIAIIAAQQLESIFEDQVAACYTFGCPRVGQMAYAESIKSAVYRVVNAGDIVTSLPFMSMGYVHVGDVRYLAQDGSLYRGGLAANRMSLLGGALKMMLGQQVQNHSLDEYIRKLEKIARERNEK